MAAQNDIADTEAQTKLCWLQMRDFELLACLSPTLKHRNGS